MTRVLYDRYQEAGAKYIFRIPAALTVMRRRRRRGDIRVSIYWLDALAAVVAALTDTYEGDICALLIGLQIIITNSAMDLLFSPLRGGILAHAQPDIRLSGAFIDHLVILSCFPFNQ